MDLNVPLATRLAAARELPAPALRRAIREAAGVSLRDLAQVVGVSHQTIALYEAGRRRPRPLNLVKYAAALSELVQHVAGGSGG